MEARSVRAQCGNLKGIVPNALRAPGGWYEGMKLDPRVDTVFSTRDENLHADLRSREIGAVCDVANSLLIRRH